MMRRVLKRGKTSERVDDNEESMQKRLKNFHQDIIPILEHYQSMGKVRKVGHLPTRAWGTSKSQQSTLLVRGPRANS